MKKINLLVALFFAAAIGSAIFGQGKPTTPPGGSYTETCENFKAFDNKLLTADCKAKAEVGSGPFGLFNKTNPILDTSLDFFFTCRNPDGSPSDIANIDGKLCCSRTLDTPQFKAAAKAFDTQTEALAGGIVIFDADPDIEIQKWIAEYLKNDFGLSNYEKRLTATQVHSTVVGYIKKNPTIQDEIIHQAYKVVFQRDAMDGELNMWRPKVAAGTALYGTIFKEISKKK